MAHCIGKGTIRQTERATAKTWEDNNAPYITNQLRPRQPPQLRRRRRCRRIARGHRRDLRDRARAERPAEGRRSVAALGCAGGDRAGLSARRRACAADLQGAGPARARDHERGHRNQRRGGASASGKADQRRCAAFGRRLRFRTIDGHRAGCRAEGHSLRHQHRGGAADHRAGLQIRVPQFPDRTHDPQRRLRQPEGIVRRARRGADALLMVSRLNDAMLITRELVKQRWSPMVVLSMGPGWYEDQYLKTLGKLSDGPMSFVPWYDPNKKLAQQLEGALAKAYPGINMNTNHVFTFEALLVAADAYKRARSSDPKALADAIRTTNIIDNVSIGPGIQFNDKGQNDKLKNAAIQNRGGKLLTIAPKTASNAKPELPMSPYDRRG